MDLKITFETDNAVQKAVAFKTFVEEHKLDGVESVEVERKAGKPGDQGIGSFLGSIIASITDNSESFKGLIGVVSRFLELFDGRLVMEDGEGRKLVIPGGKKLTPEQKEKIAVEFSKHK